MTTTPRTTKKEIVEALQDHLLNEFININHIELTYPEFDATTPAGKLNAFMKSFIDNYGHSIPHNPKLSDQELFIDYINGLPDITNYSSAYFESYETLCGLGLYKPLSKNDKEANELVRKSHHLYTYLMFREFVKLLEKHTGKNFHWIVDKLRNPKCVRL